MLRKKPRSFTLTVSIILLMLFVLTGCGGNKNTNTSANLPSNNTTAPAPQEATKNPTSPVTPVKVKLYFPTSDASGLVPVEREVSSDQDLIQKVFKELSNPPSGLVAPLPQGTTLLDAKVKDGIATLNLSKQFRNNFEGGATGEQMVLYSIVNSLTSLPNIQSVEFRLEGAQTVAILGGLDTSTPVKRNESLIVKQ